MKKIEEQLQKKYMELQMLKQQASGMLEQKRALDEKAGELRMSIDALKNLDTIKNGEEIWSSLGSGTFVRSDIKDTSKVLVAVGAGVVLSETAAGAVKILQSRIHEIETVDKEIVTQAEAYLERINKLEPEVEKLAEELGKE